MGGYVYLLHFERPIAPGQHTTQHYIGHADDLARRIDSHRRGRYNDGSGCAKLCAVAKERGIGFTVARLWRGGYKLERRLRGEASRAAVLNLRAAEAGKVCGGSAGGGDRRVAVAVLGSVARMFYDECGGTMNEIETKLTQYQEVHGFQCPAEFSPALGIRARRATWASIGRGRGRGQLGRWPPVAGRADWPSYRALMSHNTPNRHLFAWLLGGSDIEAVCWLIVDRKAERAWMVPTTEAANILRAQWSWHEVAPLPSDSMKEWLEMLQRLPLACSLRCFRTRNWHGGLRRRIGVMRRWCRHWRSGGRGHEAPAARRH